MKLQNKLALWVTMLALAALTACAQIGIAPADTFAKKRAAAYTTIAAVAESTAMLLQTGRLTPTEAQRVHDQNATALTAVDAAGALAITDLMTAETRLQATIATLTVLQSYLATKQGAPK